MRMQLDPDRLLPADSSIRGIARDLYQSVADLPILSPHSHVDPFLLVRDEPFDDPAELFIRHDHYVTRLLHAAGIPLDRLGLPARGSTTGSIDPRDVWRRFCENWHLFAGTASGYWLREALVGLLGVEEHPDGANADRLFDHIRLRLTEPGLRPRALFRRFDIQVLATTDDPMDDLSGHATLADDSAFAGRVIPTFRPDKYLDPHTPGWVDRVVGLCESGGATATDFRSFIRALEGRRRFFIEHGAVSADHGVLDPRAIELSETDAGSLFDKGLQGLLDEQDAAAFRAHMLLQMARMSVEDGLVMTVHAGVFRNHSTPTHQRFGADTGHDIPVATSFVEGLRPILERYGTRPDFHLVLFTVDETTFSRELAPLAGFYPSVYIGAPWWFLDAPDAVARFRSAVTETAGFYRGSGFIDDTRAFLSIPARHDMSRRLDAGFLARLVAEGRVELGVAERIANDLVDAIPRKVFKL